MTTRPHSNALIIVDAQYDFAEGGPLAVTGSTAVFEKIAQHVQSTTYDIVITTQDWHIAPGSHWSETPDFVDSWPQHCAAGSHGAQIHADIVAAIKAKQAAGRPTAAIIKGEFGAAYSGCEGHEVGGARTLTAILDAALVREVYVCGVATDYCVAATATDLVEHGYTVHLLDEMMAAVHPEGGQKFISQFNSKTA